MDRPPAAVRRDSHFPCCRVRHESLDRPSPTAATLALPPEIAPRITTPRFDAPVNHHFVSRQPPGRRAPGRRGWLIVIPAALLLLVASCSGSDTTSPGSNGGNDGGDGGTPGGGGGTVAFTAVSGDQQQGPANVALPLRIVVKVTKGGQPSPGLTINWGVAGGVGSITPASAATDASGESAATWTLGAVTAAQTASATVAGSQMPAVIFHASVPVASRISSCVNGSVAALRSCVRIAS